MLHSLFMAVANARFTLDAWIFALRIRQIAAKERGNANYTWLLGALVFVLIAVNIVPIIVTTVSDATGTGGALEGTNVAPLFDFLPLLITIGVLVAVIGVAIARRR